MCLGVSEGACLLRCVIKGEVLVFPLYTPVVTGGAVSQMNISGGEVDKEVTLRVSGHR